MHCLGLCSLDTLLLVGSSQIAFHHCRLIPIGVSLAVPQTRKQENLGDKHAAISYLHLSLIVVMGVGAGLSVLYVVVLYLWKWEDSILSIQYIAASPTLPLTKM